MIKRKEPSDSNYLSDTSQIRVRFNETNPLGIVWHGNYITYFELGRESFGRKYGITYLDVQANNYVTPIVRSMCEHKKTLKYGEVVTIKTIFKNTSAAKMEFNYYLYNEQNELVCYGETTQVFLDLDENLSITNPLFYEQWKNKYGL